MVLSEQESELLSKTAPCEEDAAFLKQLYAQDVFVSMSFLDKLSEQEPPSETVRQQAEQILQMLGPELAAKTSIERIMAGLVAGIEEHKSSSSELLGDWPQKQKKWAIFVLPNYAQQLAKIPFAAFRLDDLNARAIVLPSGATAVVLHSSFRVAIPALVCAFLDIYKEGTQGSGVFGVSSSENTRLLLRMAKLFADKKYDELPEVMSHVRIRSTDDVLITMYVSLLTVLHECAHILLGHLASATRAQLNLNGIDSDTWEYSHSLELEADAFAVKSLLYVDEKPTKQHTFNVALACDILFGFLQLVENYSPTASSTHPKPTYRWTNVRSELVSAFESEVLVRRLETIIQVLSDIQMLETDLW